MTGNVEVFRPRSRPGVTVASKSRFVDDLLTALHVNLCHLSRHATAEDRADAYRLFRHNLGAPTETPASGCLVEAINQTIDTHPSAGRLDETAARIALVVLLQRMDAHAAPAAQMCAAEDAARLILAHAAARTGIAPNAERILEGIGTAGGRDA